LLDRLEVSFGELAFVDRDTAADALPVKVAERWAMRYRSPFSRQIIRRRSRMNWMRTLVRTHDGPERAVMCRAHQHIQLVTLGLCNGALTLHAA
jgi:hypothetical protein